MAITQIECFALEKGVCKLLIGQDVPRSCLSCSFRKPDREVTDGKRYPFIQINK